MASSTLAATIVTNLMINLRCVASDDKPLALGFETTLLGILPYIPGKLVYSAVAGRYKKSVHYRYFFNLLQF